jgi:hypothetical protein
MINLDVIGSAPNRKHACGVRLRLGWRRAVTGGLVHLHVRSVSHFLLLGVKMLAGQSRDWCGVAVDTTPRRSVEPGHTSAANTFRDRHR